MQGMRILHALHGFPPEFFGGSELYVRALAKSQVQGGHVVEIVAGTNEDGPPGCFTSEHQGLTVHRLRRSGLFHERWDHGDSPAETTLYWSLLEEFRPDLVHIHHWKRLSRDLVRVAQAMDIPTVLTLHDLFVTCPRVFRVRAGESFCERPLSAESCGDCVPREDWMGDDVTSLQIEWFAQAFREELAAASTLVVPSMAHAEFLARHLSQGVEDFVVLPHGSILSWPSRERSLGWNGEGRLRIAHWGHLQELKGVHVLAEALSLLPDKDGVELVLWGQADDPDFDQLLLSSLDGIAVERRETFTRDDIQNLDAHVAVFPTLAHESHSFVLDEAFALGLPVLTSARGAMPERIGKGGLVFPPGDAVALASLLQELLDSPEKLKELAQQLPEPKAMSDHCSELEQIYIDAASQAREPLAGQALARARRYEELVQILEARAREIEGLRERVTSEASHLERSLGDLEGSVAAYRAEILEKDRDLENHRAELARVEGEFEVTEAALIAERAALCAEREASDAVRRQLGDVEDVLEAERAEHEEAGRGLAQAIAETERLLQELEDSLAEVTRMSSRVDELEQSEARLLEEKACLTAYSTQLRRENRLALPLVLPARLLIAIKDRLLGPPKKPPSKKTP